MTVIWTDTHDYNQAITTNFDILAHTSPASGVPVFTGYTGFAGVLTAKPHGVAGTINLIYTDTLGTPLISFSASPITDLVADFDVYIFGEIGQQSLWNTSAGGQIHLTATGVTSSFQLEGTSIAFLDDTHWIGGPTTLGFAGEQDATIDAGSSANGSNSIVYNSPDVFGPPPPRQIDGMFAVMALLNDPSVSGFGTSISFSFTGNNNFSDILLHSYANTPCFQQITSGSQTSSPQSFDVIATGSMPAGATSIYLNYSISCSGIFTNSSNLTLQPNLLDTGGTNFVGAGPQITTNTQGAGFARGSWIMDPLSSFGGGHPDTLGLVATWDVAPTFLAGAQINALWSVDVFCGETVLQNYQVGFGQYTAVSPALPLLSGDTISYHFTNPAPRTGQFNQSEGGYNIGAVGSSVASGSNFVTMFGMLKQLDPLKQLRALGAPRPKCGVWDA